MQNVSSSSAKGDQEVTSQECTGWAALPNWVVRDPSLGPYALAILLVISSHVGPNGYALSQALIAQESGCSLATVKRVLTLLRERGLLTVVPTFRGPERGPNLYRLAFDIGPGMSPSDRGASQSEPPGLTERAPRSDRAREEEPREEEPVLARKRATAAPDRLPLSPRMEQWWAENEIAGVEPIAETRAFLDYWRARGGTFIDWEAAWRNWMRKAKPHHQPNSANSTPPSAVDRSYL